MQSNQNDGLSRHQNRAGRRQFKKDYGETRLAQWDDAVSRIDCPLRLPIMKRNDRKDCIRKAVVQKITDQQLLVEIAGTDKSASVRAKAVDRIQDPAVLCEIVFSDKSLSVRKTALKRIDDPALLARIVQDHDDPDTRAEAAKRITEPTLLAAITKTEQNPRVLDTIGCNSCLTDISALKKILSVTHSDEIRMTVLKRLIIQGYDSAVDRLAEYLHGQYADTAAAYLCEAYRETDAQYRNRIKKWKGYHGHTDEWYDNDGYNNPYTDHDDRSAPPYVDVQ